ncbi:hypothetical protein [Flocculibacter collagenilyticus]|uniref:hypothetical protein n=1 Tax=Flocculibacter collagenilyticus TaxID=2744479 RepID=UPI0018F34EC3|nr:hypothetical protein [Flocculibacter collagenilyticus]
MRNNCSYECEIKHSVVYAKLIGSFNERIAKQLYNDVQHNLLPQLKGQAFAYFVDLTEFQGATPEAHLINNQVNQLLNNAGLVNKAVLVTTNFQFDVAVVMSDALKVQKAYTKTFISKAEALEWLASKGFTIDSLNVAS